MFSTELSQIWIDFARVACGGLLHQQGYGGANDDLGVRIRVGDDRSKLMFVDLG